VISSDDGELGRVRTTGLPAGRRGGRGPHRPTGACSNWCSNTTRLSS